MENAKSAQTITESQPTERHAHQQHAQVTNMLILKVTVSNVDNTLVLIPIEESAQTNARTIKSSILMELAKLAPNIKDQVPHSENASRIHVPALNTLTKLENVLNVHHALDPPNQD